MLVTWVTRHWFEDRTRSNQTKAACKTNLHPRCSVGVRRLQLYM